VEVYAAQYEALRAQMTGRDALGARRGESPLGPTASPPGGLALVLHEGLPAWLRAVARVLATAPGAVSAASIAADRPADDTDATPCPGVGLGGSGAAGLLAATPRADVARLLAALVLSIRRDPSRTTTHRAAPGPSPALAREGASR
jgi:hypothetical protein